MDRFFLLRQLREPIRRFDVENPGKFRERATLVAGIINQHRVRIIESVGFAKRIILKPLLLKIFCRSFRHLRVWRAIQDDDARRVLLDFRRLTIRRCAFRDDLIHQRTNLGAVEQQNVGASTRNILDGHRLID